jgi:hypothetical protein
MLGGGRVPLPVGRAGFKPVGGRAGVFGRFDSCLFRSAVYSGNGHAAWIQIAAAAAPASTLPMAR